MPLKIQDTDTTTADFNEGTLTDVVAIDDSLQLANRNSNRKALYFNGVQDLNGTRIKSGLSYLINSYFELEIDIYIEEAQASFVPLIGVTVGNNMNGGIKLNGYEVMFHDFSTDMGDIDRAQTGNILTVNEWQTIKMIYDNGNIAIYRNGVLESTDTFTLSSSSSELIIGAPHSMSSSQSRRFKGYAKNAIVRNSPTNKIGWYKLDEENGSTAYDSTGSNDGTIKDGQWDTLFPLTGNRISPQLDLSAIDVVDSSLISWNEILNGETIDIETSVDNQSTWDTATNGGSIANIQGADTLDVRQILSTTDTTVTPVLEDITVEVVEFQQEFGGSEAKILISEESNGIKVYKGSSESYINISEEANGIKVYKGSSESYINISEESTVFKLIDVGIEAEVLILEESTVFKLIDVGSEAEILINSTANGFKVYKGYSQSEVLIDAQISLICISWRKIKYNESNWQNITDDDSDLWQTVDKQVSDWKDVGSEGDG